MSREEDEEMGKTGIETDREGNRREEEMTRQDKIKTKTRSRWVEKQMRRMVDLGRGR